MTRAEEFIAKLNALVLEYDTEFVFDDIDDLPADEWVAQMMAEVCDEDYETETQEHLRGEVE